jgi:A1 cistron-splicing factor AAR2
VVRLLTRLQVWDLPPGTELGIDLYSWNTGQKFLGIKMIPPGLHFVYYSATSAEGQTAPRSGFFHVFRRGEVVGRVWEAAAERLLPADDEQVERMRAGLREVDGRLGPFPHKQWSKWVSLSGRVEATGLARLLPGGTVTAASQVSGQEEQEEVGQEELGIALTALPSVRHPPGCSAGEITQHALDSSFKLEQFLEQHSNVEQVLVELQFSFLCFLVGQNYDCFEHWKQLVAMMCSCKRAMQKYPQLFLSFMSDLHFQMQEVPEDFFVDIVSQNNFLVKSLADLFANIRENVEIEDQLQTRAISFENHLSKKFGWDFSEEDDEFAPVVVEL